MGAAGFMALCLMGQAWGQPVPSPSGDSAEQRRAVERETQLREQLERAPDVRIPAASSDDMQRLPSGETPCFLIQRLELKGRETDRFGWLLDAVAGQGFDDSPLRKCLGVTGVGVILKRAQDALIARGYVTSRVLAEPQDLSAGALALTVVPGRIRAIRFADPVSDRATAWNAVAAAPGDVLNLRDLEQTLENFKRVPTAEADIQIVPTDQPGQSDLLITWGQGSPLRLSLSADDGGSKVTGKYQGSLTFSYDHFWTLNDLFYLTVNNDLGGGDSGSRGSSGHAAHYSVPMGYWLLGANTSRHRYFQTVAGATQDYVYRGASRQAEIKLSRLVHRDTASKTSVSLKAFARRSNNFIDDTEVEVQRRRTGGWELGLGRRAFVGAGTLDWNLGYRRGTGAFGATPAPEEAFGEGTSRFAWVSADASLSLPFELHGRKWRYSGHWRAQFNRTPLTPQDRFAIGGRYTVRGFDGQASLSAERGWLVRNEVATPLGSGYEAFTGLDHGHVGGPSSPNLLGRHLTGVVAGLRGSFGAGSLELFVGAPLSKPTGFAAAKPTYGFMLHLNHLGSTPQQVRVLPGRIRRAVN